MRYLIKKEFEKYIFNKKVLIVGILAIAFFLLQIISIGATNHTIYSLDKKQEYATSIESIKKRSFPATEINETFINSLNHEYKTFVDENRLSNEEIESILNESEYNETLTSVLENKYDYSYSGLIFSEEIKYGDNKLTNYFKNRFYEIITLDRLRDDIEKKFYSEENNYQSFAYLSDSQLNEMMNLMQKNILDKPYIRGYSIGFDLLSSNLQFLPFTLGILLLVSLYGIFGAEKVKKTDTLILTCKEGKSKYITAKLLTVFIYTSLTWILFQLINLIACQLLFGLEGASVSVYSFGFYSVYGYNYLEYFLHQLPVSYLGTLLLAYIISFSSQLLKPIPTLTIGTIWILLTSNVLYSFSETGYSLISKLMLLSPTQMMSAYSTYSDYTPYQILGFNINLPSLTYLILIFGLTFVIIGLYYSVRNRQIKN